MSDMGLCAEGAHPRWRGADSVVLVMVLPLMGLIPAGAGRTSAMMGDAWTCGAHPRWRGADSISP